MLFVLVLAVGAAAVLTMALSNRSAQIERERLTQLRLGEAKEALIAYATTGTLNRATTDGPGYLPCPDLDDDGLAEASCGSAIGDTGQTLRLGRLPWKTIGLPDIRDAAGERFWYAVSSVYKVSTPLPGLNPDTGLGTITVRDPAGAVVHDGTMTNTVANLYNAQSGGAVAVIFAPGATIERWENAAGTTRTVQNRTCAGGSCDAAGTCTTSPASNTPKCNPVNYLEKASGITTGEDNANFVDRNDVLGRPLNTDGFIQGPVANATGDIIVNDRLAVVTYYDIMQAMMQRVASEAYRCLLDYRNLNNGRYPYPAPACRSGYSTTNQWSDRGPILFGRIPTEPLNDTQSDGGGTMSDLWTGSCTLIDSVTPDHSPWFIDWRNHVFYAIALARIPAPTAPGACPTTSDCLNLTDTAGNQQHGKEFAVIVAGPPLNSVAPVQTRSGGGTSSSSRDPRNYLERSNVNLEQMNDISAIAECGSLPAPGHPTPAPCSPLSNCNRATVGVRDSLLNDVMRYYPP